MMWMRNKIKGLPSLESAAPVLFAWLVKLKVMHIVNTAPNLASRGKL